MRQPVRSPDELQVGGLYCYPSDEGVFRIVKVLVLEPAIVHAKLYENRFASFPTSVDPASLQCFVEHMPISPWGFVHECPHFFIMKTTVTDEELCGYRWWLQHACGGPAPH
ncbi:MAG: hypothetical protein ACJ8DQ_06455 [Xanthobacteraceae bacterium]